MEKCDVCVIYEKKDSVIAFVVTANRCCITISLHTIFRDRNYWRWFLLPGELYYSRIPDLHNIRYDHDHTNHIFLIYRLMPMQMALICIVVLENICHLRVLYCKRQSNF